MHSILWVPNSSGGQCYAEDETDYCTSKMIDSATADFFGGEMVKARIRILP